MPKRTEPPQHRSDDGAHQRAIALGENCEFARGIENLVKRTMTPQHAFENLGGEAANDKTRRVVRSARSANRIMRAFYDGEALLAAAAGLRQIKGDANKPVRSVAAGSARSQAGR